MSAFVMSKEDISILVAAGLKIAGDESPPASILGQRLLDECVRSVSYRYPNDDLGELPGCYPEETICEGIAPVSIAEWLTPYAYETPACIPTRPQIEETISSYEYQSCEHPEWESSWAHNYCIALRAALGQLPADPEPAPTPKPAHTYPDGRNETIKAIRTALKRRSGKTWSVTGGTGTGWGWITISAPPKRRTGKHVETGKDENGYPVYELQDVGEPQEFGYMTPQDCAELAQLLGKDRVHFQGESIPSSTDYYHEYIDRAEGRNVSTYGVQYWD